MKTLKVSVNDFLVHGFHGIHPLEKKIGCMFSIDLHVEFELKNKINSIEESIDYEKLLNIIREEMKVTRDLLEMVCQSIIDELSAQYKYVFRIEIRIKKLDPPVENFKGSLSVHMIQNL